MQLDKSFAASTRTLGLLDPVPRHEGLDDRGVVEAVLTTQPLRTVGPATMVGTRNPSCSNSGRSSYVVGGGTWS